MSENRERRLLWGYALLMVVVLFAYARYDSYTMDGDGVSFLDIAQFLTDGHAKLAANGYWNPGYPAVLAVAREIAHPTRWAEMAMARYTNVFVFVLTMAACTFFTTGLAALRRQVTVGEGAAAVPDVALHLLGFTLLLFSAGRELPLAAVRADTLLLAMLFVAAGLLLRLQMGARFWVYPVLGAVLGFAYLVKSFAMLPSVLLFAVMFGLALWPKTRGRVSAGGTIVAGLVFAAVAAPYVIAISRQLGHLTTGESARMNYCFFVDQTGRWHEEYLHEMGHATGPMTHQEVVLATQPPVFSYAAHAVGTFPLWFDPGYWTKGLTPHFWLKGQVARLARAVELIARFLLARPEALVLLGVLLAFGVALPRRREIWLWVWPVAWGAAMLGIYSPVDLQDRYLTGPYLLMLLPLFAWLRLGRGDGERTQAVARSLVVLLAFVAMMQAVGYLLDVRRHTVEHRGEAGYSAQMVPMARSLVAMGLKPGEDVACFGDQACYVDPMWARLAGTQILAEVSTPDGVDTEKTWRAMPDVEAEVAPLRAMGLRFIVGRFVNSAEKPKGWVQLGGTDFFVYRIAP